MGGGHLGLDSAGSWGPCGAWSPTIVWNFPEASRAFQNLPEEYTCPERQIGCTMHSL